MFDQIREDILIMVDGDDTYEAGHVHKLLEPILRGDADMTIATRLTSHEDKSFRPLHVAGNQLVCGIINWMFHSRVSDIFSGYRAFTREAIRQIPVTTAASISRPSSPCSPSIAARSSRKCPPLSRPPRRQLFQAQHRQRRLPRPAAPLSHSQTYKPSLVSARSRCCCFSWGWPPA